MFLGHVDNVRVANYASLPMANVGAPTPTVKMGIFVPSTDKRAAVPDISE